MSWKNPYVQNSLLKKVLLKSSEKRSFSFRIWSRASAVSPEFVGHRVHVHNGKNFFSFLVSQDMVGYKFGEFVPTRAKYEFKKKKKKK